MSSIFTATGSWGTWTTVLAAVVVLLLSFSIAGWSWGRWGVAGDHPYRRAFGAISRWGMTLFAVGLLMLIFIYERGLYLSSPLVVIGWGLFFLWWLWVVGLAIRRYPATLRMYHDELRRQRWLGKKKKR